MIYNKLVRDKLPEIFEKEGKSCVLENIDGEEFAKALMDNFDEEVALFKESFQQEDDENAVKKIADIVEVLYAVLDLIGVEQSSFEKIRNAEKTKFGGFENRVFLKEVTDKTE